MFHSKVELFYFPLFDYIYEFMFNLFFYPKMILQVNLQFGQNKFDLILNHDLYVILLREVSSQPREVSPLPREVLPG